MRGSMTRLVITASIAVTVGACQPTVQDDSELGVPVRTDCGAERADRFFPPGLLRLSWETPRHLRNVYAELLEGMNEPSLSCGSDRDMNVFRLGRLKWVGVPLVIRVNVGADLAATMTVVKLPGPAWNMPPGPIFEHRTMVLTRTQSDELNLMLTRSAFWGMPPTISNSDAGVGSGTTWVMERRLRNRYHVVSRFQATGLFLETGRQFMRLAGVTEKELELFAPGVPVLQPRPQPGDPPPPPPPASEKKRPRS